MFRFPVKTPKIVQRLFPKYLWKKAFLDKTIYLTFDDGPTPEVTQWTLNTLKQFNAKATFFCIGDNVRKYPEIAIKIHEEGHTIGNHTFNHLKGWNINTDQFVENTHLAQEQILKTIPNYSKQLFRPPYGKIKNKQAKTLISQGYKIVMWTVISYDWDNSLTKEDCLDITLKNTTNGTIIVFHDSLKAKENMMYTLPKFLDYYSKKGYTFKAL